LIDWITPFDRLDYTIKLKASFFLIYFLPLDKIVTLYYIITMSFLKIVRLIERLGGVI